MGAYYYVVNPVKRQYISPYAFGECFKWRWVPDRIHAVAISFLACDVTEVGLAGAPAGSWHGDKTYVTGDDSRTPNAHGIKTATLEQPSRNLYYLAHQEFEDISIACIKMLLDWREEVADTLAQIVADNPYEGKILLHNLGDIVVSDPLRDHEFPSSLEIALRECVGEDWETKCRAVKDSR